MITTRQRTSLGPGGTASLPMIIGEPKAKAANGIRSVEIRKESAAEPCLMTRIVNTLKSTLKDK